MGKIEIIAIVILFFFSFFGMMISANLLHELSHKQDYKGIAFNDSICLLEFGGDNIASYHFLRYNDNNTDLQMREINKYTEYKATGITIAIALLFLICCLIVAKNLAEKE